MRKDGGGSPRRLLCVENETTASDVVPRLLFCKGQTPQGNLSFFLEKRWRRKCGVTSVSQRETLAQAGFIPAEQVK